MRRARILPCYRQEKPGHLSTSFPEALAFESDRAPPRVRGISSGTPRIVVPTARVLHGPCGPVQPGGAHTLRAERETWRQEANRTPALQVLSLLRRAARR